MTRQAHDRGGQPDAVTRPDDVTGRPGYAEAHITARWRTLKHYATAHGRTRPDGGGLADNRQAAELTRLRAEAVTVLGPDNVVTLRVECAIQEALDATYTVDQSARTWQALYERAKRIFGPEDTTVMRIRSFSIRYMRLRGGSTDLDRGVEGYEAEWRQRLARFGPRDQRTHTAYTNLAIALRDRGGDADFTWAREILVSEVAARTKNFGPEDPFTLTAKVVLAQTLVRYAEVVARQTGEPAGDDQISMLCKEALRIVKPLVKARRRRFGSADTTLQAILVDAHAQILLRRFGDAETLIRYVRAVATRKRIWLTPGWPESLLARAQEATDPVAAGRTAHEALEAQRQYYPPGARQIIETEKLLARLERRAEAADGDGPA